MQNLSFCYRGGGTDDDDLNSFSDKVCMCLLSHHAPVLQSLRLAMLFKNDYAMDIEAMNLIMGVAFGLRVRELTLRVYSPDANDKRYRFPPSLLYTCGTLETLKLDFRVLVDVPFPVLLKSLTTLRLYEVSFGGDESVVNLLSGCSVLERLEVVRRGSHFDVETFTIDVPSLHSLTLVENIECSTLYKINAPSLKDLTVQGLRQDDDDSSCLIENMPELVEADIGVCGVIYENIHGSLASVKRLSLRITSPLDLNKFSTDRIFNQLVYLELDTDEPEWWNLLMIMLDSSPNLQVLKLTDEWRSSRDQLDCMRWSQPKNVQECLVNRLETLVWKNYNGEIEDEKEVAQYILRNASRLETATFSRRRIQPEKRLEWLKELESVVRASNSCQLVFK